MPLSRDEFHKKYRGRMLLFLTDAWAARRGPPSDLGRLIDEHALELKRLLAEMYDDLAPEHVSPVHNGLQNGHHPKASSK